MDVAYQLQEIGLLFANNRLVPVLKQMTRTLVTDVEVYGIPGEQSAHKGRESVVSRTEKKVEVVGHQRPGETIGTGLNEEL